MATLLKTVEEPLTEEFMASLVGLFVHVSVNEHEVQEDIDGSKEVRNVWFAGKVAGFEKAILSFDWASQKFINEPVTHFTMLMTDGTGWLMSQTKTEVQGITEDEFVSMVASETAKQAVEQELTNPVEETPKPNLVLINGNREAKILKPGEDF